MSDALKVLVVDDEEQIRHMLQEALTQSGHRVSAAASGEEALHLLEAGSFGVVLLDLKMPGMDGLEVLKALRDGGIEVEVVILTGYADVESAIAAMKLGAHDFLQKPFDLGELEQVLLRAAKSRRLKRQRGTPQPAIAERAPQRAMLLGADPKILEVRSIIQRVAPSDTTVLITGESGTGKELVAGLLHAQSPRSGTPLTVVDCPAVSISLFESELFGHERGAFTGAMARRRGKLEEADGGTLFLDEVGELPLEVQAKLLRFLQEGRVTRLGGNQSLPVNARIISATNRDLVTMVRQGTFRLDLFYRLNVVEITMPSLRERTGDVPRLAAHFLERWCRGRGVSGRVITPETLALLGAHSWPGNVRELENAITRACALTPGHVITPESLPPYLLRDIAPTDGGDSGNTKRLVEMERQYILDVLDQEQWHITRAARVLGIHRATLYRKIVALDLRPAKLREG